MNSLSKAYTFTGYETVVQMEGVQCKLTARARTLALTHSHTHTHTHTPSENTALPTQQESE